MKRHLYWNANGFAVAIVAVEGGNKDWAAYIGATSDDGFLEAETVEFVEVHGCKIAQSMAQHLFPEFAEESLAWRP